MEDYLKEAVEIVKAQASVRTMTEEEITSMVQKLAMGIRSIKSGSGGDYDPDGALANMDSKKAIKEKSITCLECGKTFKVLTKRHLKAHGLTPAEYKEKHGYKKDVSLIAKGLARDRRKKMLEMELWKKKKNNKK